MEWYNKLSLRTYILTAVGIITITAIILLAMGQVPICKCGYVMPWHGVVFSSENSQHLSDWYSFTHILHGLGFYFLTWIFFRKLPFGLRLLIALGLEGAWEILENTDMIINRYREVTISLDYFGDSVINSISDMLFMAFGFFLSYRLPVWGTLLILVAIEGGLAYFIRDNLTINIIMLIYPIDAILQWQTG